MWVKRVVCCIKEFKITGRPSDVGGKKWILLYILTGMDIDCEMRSLLVWRKCGGAVLHIEGCESKRIGLFEARHRTGGLNKKAS